MYHGNGLHIRGQDLGMFPQVQEKGITRPTTFDFHDIEGNASKKILKGGTYLNSMSLEWAETCSLGGLGGDLQEFTFRETMVRAIDYISKEQAICGRFCSWTRLEELIWSLLSRDI